MNGTLNLGIWLFCNTGTNAIVVGPKARQKSSYEECICVGASVITSKRRIELLYQCPLFV